jgi:hypothetical protein
MTDDDDLRDEFGDELRAALNARARSEPIPEVTLDSGPATHRRARRRLLVATLSAVVAVVAVAGVAVLATSGHDTRRIGVVATPSSAPAATAAPEPGFRLVSFHGVHVEVPASWPVVDGMHTRLCYGPFADAPTAFVGPQENGPPSCPAMPALLAEKRDGVWLQTGNPPENGRPSTTSSGEVVLEDVADRRPNVQYFWFRQVTVTVGIGTNPRVARAIVDSIGFTPGAPDTPAAGVCARIADPNAMPAPERLSTRLVLENGRATLDPPLPADRATMTPEQAWRDSGTKQNFEHFRLVLARYSAALPATQHPDGSLTPEHRNQLMWIVLSAPNSPEIQGCGMWGFDLFDARTGQALESAGYSDGP